MRPKLPRPGIEKSTDRKTIVVLGVDELIKLMNENKEAQFFPYLEKIKKEGLLNYTGKDGKTPLEVAKELPNKKFEEAIQIALLTYNKNTDRDIPVPSSSSNHEIEISYAAPLPRAKDEKEDAKNPDNNDRFVTIPLSSEYITPGNPENDSQPEPSMQASVRDLVSDKQPHMVAAMPDHRNILTTFFGCSLVLCGVIFCGYKYIWKRKSAAKRPETNVSPTSC